MKHRDHCFHCGERMTGKVCTNERCGISRNTLPVWPWSVCQGCDTRGYRIMNWSQLLRQTWILLIGVVFFLFGLFGLMFSIQLTGFILIIIWFLIRTVLDFSRSTHFKLLTKESEQREKQAQFDAGKVKDTPTNRKELKEKSDKIRSLEWSIYGFNLARKMLWVTMVMIVLGMFLTYTPGITPQSPSIPEKIQNKISETVGPIFEKMIEDAKESLDWRQKKIEFVYNKAMNRGMSYEQCEKIEKLIESQGEGALDECVEILQKTNLNNQELYHKLVNTFQNNQDKKKEKVSDGSNSEPKRHSILANIKYYFDVFYLQNWSFFLLLEVIVVLIWLVLIAGVIFCFGFSFAYMAGETVWNNLKWMFETYGETRQDLPKIKNNDHSQTKVFWRSVLGSMIGIMLIKFLFSIIDKLGRK